MIGVGDVYIDQEVKVKEYVQHLSQTLTVTNEFACIRDFSPRGLLHSFEPADKVLLKSWTTASPESQLGGKWTGPWNILLTTPTMVKLVETKPWTHHIRIKKALEEQWTIEPQKDLKVIFENNNLCFFLYLLFNPLLWTTYSLK